MSEAGRAFERIGTRAGTLAGGLATSADDLCPKPIRAASTGPCGRPVPRWNLMASSIRIIISFKCTSGEGSGQTVRYLVADLLRTMTRGNLPFYDLRSALFSPQKLGQWFASRRASVYDRRRTAEIRHFSRRRPVTGAQPWQA